MNFQNQDLVPLLIWLSIPFVALCSLAAFYRFRRTTDPTHEHTQKLHTATATASGLVGILVLFIGVIFIVSR